MRRGLTLGASAITAQPSILDAGKQRRLMLLSYLRLLLAASLVVYLSVGWVDTSKNPNTLSSLLLAAIYALMALAALWVLKFSHINWQGQIFAQLLADVLLIGLLVYSLGGSGGGYAILYFMPIVCAASLLNWSSALFICSLSVISLLLDGLRRMVLAQQEVDWFVLGMQGLISFLLTCVMRYTAARAEITETAQRKAQLQTLLVQELQEKHIAQDSQAWLVVDAQRRVHMLNVAARSLAWQAGVVLEIGDTIGQESPLLHWCNAALLGAQGLQGSQEHSIAWPPLPNTQHPKLQASLQSQQIAQQNLQLNQDLQTPLLYPLLYVKATTLPHLQGYTALTMELHAKRAERNQQQHLAAMGRISASIAHEIRNPLAAISQAAELMSESAPPASADGPLLKMMLSNTQRIERIVHNLLAWSHGMHAKPSLFDPVICVPQMVHEIALGLDLADGQIQFVGQANLDTPITSQALAQNDTLVDQPLRHSRHQFHSDSNAQSQVLFDLDHLYQVLSNLLSNAARYASGDLASIKVCLRQRGRHVALLVCDNGEPINAHVQAHLFEPFQSAAPSKGGALDVQGNPLRANTRGRGTGLGLFLCREYAQANGGSLECMLASGNPVNNHDDSWVSAPYTKAFVLNMPIAT